MKLYCGYIQKEVENVVLNEKGTRRVSCENGKCENCKYKLNNSENRKTRGDYYE